MLTNTDLYSDGKLSSQNDHVLPTAHTLQREHNQHCGSQLCHSRRVRATVVIVTALCNKSKIVTPSILQFSENNIHTLHTVISHLEINILCTNVWQYYDYQRQLCSGTMIVVYFSVNPSRSSICSSMVLSKSKYMPKSL